MAMNANKVRRKLRYKHIIYKYKKEEVMSSNRSNSIQARKYLQRSNRKKEHIISYMEWNATSPRYPFDIYTYFSWVNIFDSEKKIILLLLLLMFSRLKKKSRKNCFRPKSNFLLLIHNSMKEKCNSFALSTIWALSFRKRKIFVVGMCKECAWVGKNTAHAVRAQKVEKSCRRSPFLYQMPST